VGPGPAASFLTPSRLLPDDLQASRFPDSTETAMSTSILMNMSVQAMFAAQAQLATTGHNIVNASVKGYSRQEVKLSTVAGQQTSGGYIGRGVSVQTVERSYNAFLSGQVTQTQAQAAADSTRLGLLEQLESAYGLGEEGLGQATADLYASFSDLAAAPTDESVREVVLGKAQELTSRFRATGDQIEQLHDATLSEIEDQVSLVNGLTAKIASLNSKLAGTASEANQPNDLLDQRDQLIKELSQHIEVSRVDTRGADGKLDGTVSLFAAGGQALVMGSDTRELSVSLSDGSPRMAHLEIESSGTTRPLDSDSITGGNLGGLLRFQNEDLSEARNQLGMLATVLADTINTQHAQGTDLDGNAGSDLLSVGEASVRPGDRNARDALGQPATSVQITRVAGSGADLRASDYELRTDPSDASAYQVTRLSDGKVFSGVASGATLDGFRIDVSGSAMASGDRFTLQPVSQAAQNAGVAIADGRKIAAAGSASAGSGNANALKLQSLATAKTFEGRSFTDAHSRMVADLGVKVQRAESDSTASTAVADRVTEQISSETGVNLEEEAARLIQFQQNYQVAAKVLNTTQKIFDTILSIMN